MTTEIAVAEIIPSAKKIELSEVAEKLAARLKGKRMPVKLRYTVNGPSIHAKGFGTDFTITTESYEEGYKVLARGSVRRKISLFFAALMPILAFPLFGLFFGFIGLLIGFFVGFIISGQILNFPNNVVSKVETEISSAVAQLKVDLV